MYTKWKALALVAALFTGCGADNEIETQDLSGEQDDAKADLAFRPRTDFLKPKATITEPGWIVLYENTVRVSGLVTAPIGEIGYRWTVFDENSQTERQLSTAPSFSWQPSQTLPSWPSRYIQLRLYGSAGSRTTLATKRIFMDHIPR